MLWCAQAAVLGDGGISAANPFTDLDLGQAPPAAPAAPVTGNLLRSGDDLGGGGGDNFPPTPAPSPIPLAQATPPQASPARQAAVAATKNAFDDLNDSIRAALGKSPARPAGPILPGAPSVAAPVGGGGAPPPALGAVPPGMAPPAAMPLPAGLYGSPLKQPFAAGDYSLAHDL